MPEERIDTPEEARQRECRDRGHNPAPMKIRPPGRYLHTCPSCGKITVFTVPSTRCLV